MSKMHHLSAMDSAFLHLESPEMPMHVGSLALFDPPAGGATDWYEAVKAHVASRMHLAPVFTRKLANLLAEQWFESKPMKQYTPAELAHIAEKLANWQVVPAGTEGYRTAEVTLGGVDTNELSSKTMEAKKQPGLYFVGEVVDVTGWLGGYNFQWAWASGWVAGQYC